MILPLSDKSACLSLQSLLTSHQSLWVRLCPFVISAVLTLNFAHFREDSSRAKAALPRRHADTPIRRYADTIAICGCGYGALRPTVQKVRLRGLLHPRVSIRQA